MATCSVRWRSSGGRGEFEYVPADTLVDRNISVLFEPLNVTIPAEVRGVHAQGKPRLRKFDANNRKKFHLPQLVMAVVRLPEPAREDINHAVSFPLENKAFVMDAMDFDIIDDDGINVTIAPLRVTILHSNFEIELQDRLDAIAVDIANIGPLAKTHPDVAAAIKTHADLVMLGVNDVAIRAAADEVIRLQEKAFGMTNVGSVSELTKAETLPPSEFEDAFGKEGKLLTRIHTYKERDPTIAALAKKHFRSLNGGKLICGACKMDPVAKYGPAGERCIEAHHKTPIEELQPDSVTKVSDFEMVCASCHRIIHSVKPCLTVDQVLAMAPATKTA